MAIPDPKQSESPEDMIFAENLKEFGNRVGLIVGLEQGDKISGDEAYKRVKKLWKLLKKSHRSLISEELDRLTGEGETDSDDDNGEGGDT